MRAIGASEKMASVAAGRIELLEARPEHLEVAGNQAVDQIEAGDVRRRTEEHVEPPERRRRPAEQVVEHIDQDQAGEEHRQRHAGGGDDAAGVIDQRARPRRRHDAERHRDQHRHDQAEQRQLGRGRQPGQDLLADRLAGGQRIAEIAAREVARHSRPNCTISGWSSPSLTPDLLDRLLGRGGAGEIGRRIARQRARQQERDDHHADQARHRDQHPLEDHAEHRCVPCVTRMRASGSPWPDRRRSAVARPSVRPSARRARRPLGRRGLPARRAGMASSETLPLRRDAR